MRLGVQVEHVHLLCRPRFGETWYRSRETRKSEGCTLNPSTLDVRFPQGGDRNRTRGSTFHESPSGTPWDVRTGSEAEGAGVDDRLAQRDEGQRLRNVYGQGYGPSADSWEGRIVLTAIQKGVNVRPPWDDSRHSVRVNCAQSVLGLGRCSQGRMRNTGRSFHPGSRGILSNFFFSFKTMSRKMSVPLTPCLDH